MAPQPTTPANLTKIRDMVTKVEPVLCALWSRWQDEKKHEDINKYADLIAKELPAGIKIESMSKRPFGFAFSVGTDARYIVTCTASSIGWKRTA